MPSTATLAFFAAASSRVASRRLRGAGYAASSVVVTIGTRRLRISSNCGSTTFSDELVQSTATSGLVALIVRPSIVGDPHAQLSPSLDHVADDRVRPSADRRPPHPTILNPLRDAICRATSAPIGPSPTCITRIMAAIIGKIRTVPDSTRRCLPRRSVRGCRHWRARSVRSDQRPRLNQVRDRRATRTTTSTCASTTPPAR